jgi:hypothetical protein
MDIVKSIVVVELNEVRYLCNCSDNNVKEITFLSQGAQGVCDDDLIVSSVTKTKIKCFPAHSCTKIEDVDRYEDGRVHFWIEKVEWENGEIQEGKHINKKTPSGGGLGRARLPEKKVDLPLEKIN